MASIIDVTSIVMKNKAFDRSHDYFIAHQDQLARDHHGEVVVIQNGRVDDYFESERDAFLAAKEKHPTGTYIIRKCIGPDEERKVIIRSRAWS